MNIPNLEVLIFEELIAVTSSAVEEQTYSYLKELKNNNYYRPITDSTSDITFKSEMLNWGKWIGKKFGSGYKK